MWSEGIFLRYNDSVRGNDRRKDLPARQKNKQTYAFNIPTHGFSSWHNIYNSYISFFLLLQLYLQFIYYLLLINYYTTNYN